MPELLPLLEWLENTAIGTEIREGLYAYPMLHWVHILSNSLMFGTIVFLDLRLVGFGLKSRKVTDIAEQLLPWTWVGWCLMFLSGGLLFTADAIRFSESGLFIAKMSLMVLAAINALIFHKTAYRHVEKWNEASPPPIAARLAGAVSILTWMAIITTGRWVGYTAY